MMKNLFNSIQLKKPRTNWFDLGHDVKFSGNMGQLLPVLVMDCVPGDKVKISNEVLVRMAPMLAPIMHRCDVFIHHFFVPNRIMWDNWETFITGGETTDTVPPVPPTFNITEANYTPLCDALGIPTPEPAATEKVSAFPFNAYQMIYNEYYRDQNLVPDVYAKLINGNNTIGTNFNLRNRAWEHDYFTSCLPFAQKGPAVDVPLGDVQLKDDFIIPGDNTGPHFKDGLGALPYGPVEQVAPGGPGPATSGLVVDTGGSELSVVYDPAGSLSVTPTTISDLRTAYSLQLFLEKNARGGTRYFENILAHFGVRSPDSRLQRPEYISGSRQPIMFSEVLNTTGTEDIPQGAMAGHGISYTNGRQGSYYCQEHGWVIGIMSVMPKTAYQQGIHRSLLRETKEEYYWPDFANLGEQAVKNREIYAWQGAAGDDTFGYNPMYSEYRYMNSRVYGEFKTTLNYWHMGRIFQDPPALNSQFITSDPTHRIFAVTDDEISKLYCHVRNNVMVKRPMPKFATPLW